MVRSFLTIAALSMAASMFTAEPAKADPYRWCADYTVLGGIGGRNCYFMTIEQCRAAVSGVGGMCVPNPFYDGTSSGTDNVTQPRRIRRPS